MVIRTRSSGEDKRGGMALKGSIWQVVAAFLFLLVFLVWIVLQRDVNDVEHNNTIKLPDSAAQSIDFQDAGGTAGGLQRSVERAIPMDLEKYVDINGNNMSILPNADWLWRLPKEKVPLPDSLATDLVSGHNANVARIHRLHLEGRCSWEEYEAREITIDFDRLATNLAIKCGAYQGSVRQKDFYFDEIGHGNEFLDRFHVQLLSLFDPADFTSTKILTPGETPEGDVLLKRHNTERAAMVSGKGCDLLFAMQESGESRLVEITEKNTAGVVKRITSFDDWVAFPKYSCAFPTVVHHEFFGEAYLDHGKQRDVPPSALLQINPETLIIEIGDDAENGERE